MFYNKFKNKLKEITSNLHQISLKKHTKLGRNLEKSESDFEENYVILKK